jgi:hypothetical protein
MLNRLIIIKLVHIRKLIIVCLYIITLIISLLILFFTDPIYLFYSNYS